MGNLCLSKPLSTFVFIGPEHCSLIIYYCTTVYACWDGSKLLGHHAIWEPLIFYPIWCHPFDQHRRQFNAIDCFVSLHWPYPYFMWYEFHVLYLCLWRLQFSWAILYRVADPINRWGTRETCTNEQSTLSLVNFSSVLSYLLFYFFTLTQRKYWLKYFFHSCSRIIRSLFL